MVEDAVFCTSVLITHWDTYTTDAAVGALWGGLVPTDIWTCGCQNWGPNPQPLCSVTVTLLIHSPRSSKLNPLHTNFHSCSFKVSGMVFKCCRTSRCTQCFSNQESALSAFIVPQLYSNSADTSTRCPTESRTDLLLFSKTESMGEKTQGLWAWLQDIFSVTCMGWIH